LKANPDKLDWFWLSDNPEAISLLEAKIKEPPIVNKKKYSYDYHNKIVWEFISGNPGAIPLLEKYPDKIVWKHLSKNPNIMDLFNYNFNTIEYGIFNQHLGLHKRKK
jgi:hypothetical protein